MPSISDPRLISDLVQMEAGHRCKVRTTMSSGTGEWIASVFEVQTDRQICVGRGPSEEGAIRDAVTSFSPENLTKTAEKLASENENLRKRIEDLESKVETESDEEASSDPIDDSAADPPKRKTRKKRVTRAPRSDFVIDPDQNISGK